MSTFPSPPGPNRRRVSLRDVARAAGVSVATVSRVMNASPTVSAETRLRVEEAIRTLGFTPNPIARALNTRRTHTLGALIPTLSHSIFATFLDALETELAMRGYSVIVATTGHSQVKSLARARALLELGAEGIVLSGATHSAELIELLQLYRVPVVCTSIYRADAPFPTIGYDNRELARQAYRHLTALGHRRIAVLHGPTEENDRTRERIAGVALAAGETGTVPAFTETEVSERGGAEAVRAELARGGVPTAYLCLSDVLSLGALFALQRAGVRVPEDVSVMGFDNLGWAREAHPPLTSVAVPGEEMGRETARALVDALERSKPIQSQLLPGRLMLRRSTGRPG